MYAVLVAVWRSYLQQPVAFLRLIRALYLGELQVGHRGMNNFYQEIVVYTLQQHFVETRCAFLRLQIIP